MRRVAQGVDRFFEHRFQRAGGGKRVFFSIDIERGQRGGGGERVARIGVAVQELDGLCRALHQRLIDGFAHQHRAHRHHAIGQPLGGGDDVRRDAEALGGKGRADAAKRGDDFVENQQNAVAIADLAQALEIADGRHQNAGGAGHRLDNKCGNIAGVVQRAQALQVVGQMGAPARLAAREGHVGE